MSPNIQDLLRQIAEKDSHQAFEKIYELYFRKSYTFAKYFVKTKEASEEVVSEVFLSIWKNRQSLMNVRDWDSYLYISIKNQSLLYLNTFSSKETIPLDFFSVFLSVDKIDPERSLLAKELEFVLTKSIEQLPDRCKMIYSLVKDERMSYKQVAEILDISERTVNTQMTLAIKKLRQAIRNYLK